MVSAFKSNKGVLSDFGHHITLNRFIFRCLCFKELLESYLERKKMPLSASLPFECTARRWCSARKKPPPKDMRDRARSIQELNRQTEEHNGFFTQFKHFPFFKHQQCLLPSQGLSKAEKASVYSRSSLPSRFVSLRERAQSYMIEFGPECILKGRS